MARPLTDLSEKFILINKLISEIKHMDKASDAYINATSDEFADVCSSLTRAAAEVSGSYAKAFDDILQLPDGEYAAKGFLKSLGALAGSGSYDGRIALGHIYNLVRESNHKILTDLREGFFSRPRHFSAEPYEQGEWTDKTPGFLVLAEPVKLLDYRKEVIALNKESVVDVLKTLNEKDDSGSNLNNFKECFVQVFKSSFNHFEFSGYAEGHEMAKDVFSHITGDSSFYETQVKKSSPDLLDQLTGSKISGADCSKKIVRIATMLANPGIYDRSTFRADVYSVSLNETYMKTSFLVDFTTSYNTERQRQPVPLTNAIFDGLSVKEVETLKEGSYLDLESLTGANKQQEGFSNKDFFVGLSSQQIQDFKDGLYLFQQNIGNTMEDPKILLASMMLNISAGQGMDIKAERNNDPLWLEKSLASEVGDLKSIDKSEDPASVYLAVLMKNALGLDFEQKLPLDACEKALYGQGNRPKADYSDFNVR